MPVVTDAAQENLIINHLCSSLGAKSFILSARSFLETKR